MYPSTQILFENDTTPFTVSRLNHQIRTMLEANASHILLIGEISNFSRPTSGHWYFTLKDDSAQIRAAMFRGNNRTVKFNPQNGMQVIVRANVTLYEPRGDYQLVVETIQQAGEGLLQQKFDALKVKLQQEGLFNLEYKKSLPKDPSCVGIITSASGAALQDILHVLKRRDPSLAIVIYPAMVQGQQATDMLVDMIHLANRRQECDVLILARGGGSLEDLWCFNEERLARAIFSSTIPIVSGVGHETDVTIADFVADLRAPTPSAAAELVSRDSVELLQALQRIWQRLQMAVDYHLQYIKQKQDQLVYELKYQDPKLKITRQLMAILTAQNQLVHLINQRVNKEKQELNETKNLLGHFKFYEKGEQKIQALRLRLLACDPLIKTKAYQQEIYRSLVNLQSHILQHIKRKQSTLNSIDSTLYPLAIEGVMSLKKVQAKIEQRFFNIDLQNQVLQAKHTRAWLEQKMVNLTENLLTQKRTELGTFSSQLDSLSPLKYLQRGYAVALTNDNHRIKSRKQVKQGDRINMQVEDGLIITEVLSTSKKPLVQNKKV